MLRRTSTLITEAVGGLLGSKKEFPANIAEQGKAFTEIFRKNDDVQRAVQHLSTNCNREQRDEGLKWLIRNGSRLWTEDSVGRWTDYVNFMYMQGSNPMKWTGDKYVYMGKDRDFKTLPINGDCNAKISLFHAKQQRQRPQSTPHARTSRWKRKRASPHSLPRRDALGRFVATNGKRARRKQSGN
jgi:hypothetical protein